MYQNNCNVYPVWCVPFASLAPTWTVCCMLLLCWSAVRAFFGLDGGLPFTVYRFPTRSPSMLTVCFLFKPVSGVTIKTVLKLCVCILPSASISIGDTVLRSWEGTGVNPGSHLSLDPHQHYSPALLPSSIGPVAQKHTHEHLLSPPEIKDLAPTANW